MAYRYSPPTLPANLDHMTADHFVEAIRYLVTKPLNEILLMKKVTEKQIIALRRSGNFRFIRNAYKFRELLIEALTNQTCCDITDQDVINVVER